MSPEVHCSPYAAHSSYCGGARLPAGLVSASACSSQCAVGVAAGGIYERTAFTVGRMGSPLAAMDHQLLTAHMAQHLLLMTVAAPLILLGAPAIALLHGLPQRFALSAGSFCDARRYARLDDDY